MTLTVQTRPAQVEEILALRHRILRAGKPFDSARFDCDGEAQHFAAQLDDVVVACLSFVNKPLDGEDAWQLRGMACDGQCQGKGIGKQLLEFAESQIADQHPGATLWCNAREKAVGFYERCGWTRISEQFDIENVGPHYKMAKRGNA